ncbi:hypothetical protein [Microbulbifer zhoushanensis]|uniref:AbiU2 domain-containing protein n=1 Tax=Microbulbifer TaxID=48073 RepID=UPI001F47C4B8|nr:hypothetical protein [Microbulbifer zhoushanensis]
MKSKIQKLEGHASQLLDGFIHLREKYALLHPMLFDENVVKLRGSNLQARGFLTLRHSLFLTCAQDIAKLTFDKDKRAPSIRKLFEELKEHSISSSLKDSFSIWKSPSLESEKDPEIAEALKRIEVREQEGRRRQFEEILCSAQNAWATLSNAAYMKGFLTIRDKITAHTEVQHVVDKYQPIDIGTLGIKWGDLKRAIEEMQELVESLNLLIRNSGFAWDQLDHELSKASENFWDPSN